MQLLGKVQDWNDERGYGFIAPLDTSHGGGRTFFHIRDYRQQGRRPEPGELVKYLVDRQDDGRWRATQVIRAAQPVRKSKSPAHKSASPRNPYTAGRDALRVALVLGYAALLAWAIDRELLPLESAFAPILMSIVTYLAYAADKHLAQRERQRIPEANLHLLEFLCGWPGALFSQRVLRHKSRKASYLIQFWLMVTLNVCATGAWIYWKS
ncbi:MAG: DUF1294 domain-containing protein [Pseudoxanthomonas sp.]